jgi:predicted small secreted protein
LKNLVLWTWIVLMLGAAGCNTMRGAGEDVEAAGEGVQDVSEDTEEELENEGTRT